MTSPDAAVVVAVPSSVRQCQWLVGLTFFAVWILGPLVGYRWYEDRRAVNEAREDARRCKNQSDAACELAAWGRMLALRPDDREAIVRSCVAREEGDDGHAALRACDRALAGAEVDSDGEVKITAMLERRAAALEQIGEGAKAREAIDGLLGRPNVDVTRWRTVRARSLLNTGESGPALSELDQAIAARTSNAIAAHRMREKIMAAADRHQASRPDLDAILAVEPADSELRMKRARVRLAAGDTMGARQDFELLAKRDATWADPQVGLADDVALAEDDPKGAATVLRKVLKRDPALATARAGQAHAHVLRNHGREAADLLAGAGDPLDAADLIRLGQAEHALCARPATRRRCDDGLRTRWRAHLGRFLELAGDDPRREAIAALLAAPP